MGKTISTLNLLRIQLNNFKDFWTQAGHLGLVVWKSKFSILCRDEQLALSVGWPEEGTFGLPTIY